MFSASERNIKHIISKTYLLFAVLYLDSMLAAGFVSHLETFSFPDVDDLAKSDRISTLDTLLQFCYVLIMERVGLCYL